MATDPVERELVTLERKYWQAIKDKNIDTALQLTDDPCLVAGPQGVQSISKKESKGMMDSATHRLDEFSIDDDVKVRVLGDDMAVLAYNVHEEMTVDGKPLSLDAAETSTWVRRNGRWLCAMHSESLKGDPFGRDRVTAGR